jgi:hypothetical protein
LELKFKGKRCVGRLRRKWYSELLKHEERNVLTNRKVKSEDVSIIDAYEMETAVEEEDVEVIT